MPVTNVTSVWSSGRLVFQDSTGAEIGYWDGVNRKFVLTSGANFDFSATTGSITLAAGEILTGDIGAATIATANLAALCVESCNLADTCVDTSKIADAQVTSPKIAAATIATSNIAALAVDSSQLADTCVDTSKIADAQVTSAKIAAATIDSSNYAGASIDSSHIAAATITSTNMSSLYGKRITGAIASVATSSSSLLVSIDPTTAGPVLIDGFWLERAVAVAATSGQIAAGVAVTSSDFGSNLVDTILNTTGLVGGLVGTTSYVECSSTGWVTLWCDPGSSGFVGRYSMHYWELTT